MLSFGIALIYARGGAGNQPVVGADRRIERRFYPTQALVISDGKPFKSPAVNTVASTFWYYVASTIFMALCVTQDVLKLSQLRKVSTILVLGHVFVFLLAIFRHSEEAPIRVLCRKIKRGRIAVVLKGVEPSAFNSDPQAARAFERAVEACVSGAVTVTEAKADENANRCTVTFTITSPGEEEPGGGQGDLARALRDGSFLAELTKTGLPALHGLIDAANAPIFGIDAQGVVNDWDQRAIRLTGFDAGDVMGKHLVNEFITDDYKDSVQGVFTKALNGAETTNFEVQLATKAGSRVKVLLNATSRHDENKTVIGVICAAVDKNCVMIDEIDRIDKTEFEKLYAAGGKELLEAAVFEAIDCYFKDKEEFEAPDNVEDPWERFRSQFFALETFWLEPVSAPHERKSVEIWLALEEIAEIRADLEKQVENAKEGEKKDYQELIKKLDEAKWNESKDLWYQPAFARLTHEDWRNYERSRRIMQNGARTGDPRTDSRRAGTGSGARRRNEPTTSRTRSRTTITLQNFARR